MGRTLTVYNHGTGATSEKPEWKLEIVNIFGNQDPGRCWSDSGATVKNVEKFITEGVGSKGSPQDHHYRVEDDGRITHRRDWKPHKYIEALPNLFRTISGRGVQQNVLNFLAVIQGMLDHGEVIDTINMIGWSRGAVTCIRQAYKLWELSQNPKYASAKHIKINIFAVDPVAGPGHNSEPDATQLSPLVKNYVGTIAKSENRSSFKPVCPLTDVNLTLDPLVTKAVILPFPGIHADLAKKSNAAGELAFNLCTYFLNQHGSDVSKSNYTLSRYSIAVNYAKLRAAQRGETYSEKKKYEFLGQNWHVSEKKIKPGEIHGPHGKVAAVVQGGVGTRRLAVGSSESFFINAHDKAIFKFLFPVTFDAYFGSGRQNRGMTAWYSDHQFKMAKELEHWDPKWEMVSKSDRKALAGLTAGGRDSLQDSEALLREQVLRSNGLI